MKLSALVGWIPWIPGIYSLVALGAVWLLDRKLPASLEMALSIVAAPLMLIFQPLYPVFRRLGLIEGEWMQGPTTAGVLVGSAIYGVVLWAGLKVLATQRVQL